MTPLTESTPTPTAADTDLVAAVHAVLQASPEPLTLSKIRSQLPSAFRQIGLEELAEGLRRQVAANALQQYPKYRSSQDRFWDRPMRVHVAALVRGTLQEAGPLSLSELRRKLPAYAQPLAEEVANEQLAQGFLHRHPRAGSRGSERLGAAPPEPKDYLRPELSELFRRLQPLGFNPTQLREAALELLHEEEWSVPVAPAEPAEATETGSAAGQPESVPTTPGVPNTP